MKALTCGPLQVVFLRSAAASAVLLPIMLIQGRDAFVTPRPAMHLFRGMLLALGISSWCVALSTLPLATCILVNNTIPFITMFLAACFLGETVGRERWFASIGGFVGCLFVLDPVTELRPCCLVLVLSALCFASLDILNKKFAVSESLMSMLFYGSCAMAAVSFPGAMVTWTALAPMQWAFFGVLGVG
eukprot:CAMPEP_0194548146 /NCGR_PEP_ID=MMETSP0253-20130528/93176_1 /TAXON_ID=2966 /ORGANISM="Noctiluca scintillans" /LENGTH=187 /DNA_ID=CAMNT_0039395429 /DNA_START=85 /DNA_END=644 /DNA_ORIENTATION=+